MPDTIRFYFLKLFIRIANNLFKLFPSRIFSSMASKSEYDPTEQAQALLLRDAPLLLSNPYLPMECGVGYTPDGMTHIAASTVMKNVTGAMIDWWFGWIENTEQYKLWHPRDHVYSAWKGPHGNSKYIGGHHYVHEYLGGGPMHKLRISFRSPEEYFGPNWKEEFKKAGIATAVCGRVGIWDDSDASGDSVMQTGHLIHLCHEEWYGVRMRSRFWLGDIEGMTEPAMRRVAIKPAMAKGLMQHAMEEMAILGMALPDLHAKETGKPAPKLA